MLCIDICIASVEADRALICSIRFYAAGFRYDQYRPALKCQGGIVRYNAAAAPGIDLQAAAPLQRCINFRIDHRSHCIVRGV